MIRGVFTIVEEPAVAGGGGIVILIFILAAVASSGNPSREKAHTTIPQTRPAVERKQQVYEPTPDLFAAGMPIETSTSSEMTPEPSTTTIPTETMYGLQTPIPAVTSSLDETVQMKLIEPLISIERTITGNKLNLHITVKDLTILMCTSPLTISIIPVPSDGSKVEVIDNTCYWYIDHPEEQTKLYLTVHATDFSTERGDLVLKGITQNSITISKKLALAFTSKSSTVPEKRNRMLSKEELDKMSAIIIEEMKRESEEEEINNMKRERDLEEINKWNVKTTEF